jgi:putative glutamine amidotransferase
VEQVNVVYCDAVRGAGALPFVIPVLDPIDAPDVLAGLDGLLLTGGGDLAAWSFGEEAVPEACGVDPARDTWELALVAEAELAGLPILGVCRGAQVLNVAAGGSLLQHLPAITAQAHRVTECDRGPVHSITIDPHSLLATITGASGFGVNSLHHQSVGRVGAGVRPVAWSPDGIIEAVEKVGYPHIGVQWHPELLTHRDEHARLFEWLVAAAVQHRVDQVAASTELFDAVA